MLLYAVANTSLDLALCFLVQSLPAKSVKRVREINENCSHAHTGRGVSVPVM